MAIARRVSSASGANRSAEAGRAGAGIALTPWRDFSEARRAPIGPDSGPSSSILRCRVPVVHCATWRLEQHIVQLMERPVRRKTARIRARRTVPPCVDSGAADAMVAQCVVEGGLVDHRTARHNKDHRSGFHRCQMDDQSGMMMPDGQLYDNVGVDDILVVALIFDFGLPTLTQAGQLSRKRSCWVWSALRIVRFSDDYDGTRWLGLSGTYVVVRFPPYRACPSPIGANEAAGLHRGNRHDGVSVAVRRAGSDGNAQSDRVAGVERAAGRLSRQRFARFELVLTSRLQGVSALRSPDSSCYRRRGVRATMGAAP